jgi:hypothetical protein
MFGRRWANTTITVGLLSAAVLVGGSLYALTGLPSSTAINYRSDYALVSSEALVLVPLANEEYANAADTLYLQPNGFDGTATVFITPEPGNEVASVAPGVQALVHAVESDYTAGNFSSTDPLYIFGYSQGAVEGSLAEQQLHDFGIPQDALHFVMVGDSASTEGGILTSFVDSLPESWQQPANELLALLGITPPVLGATTPDDLYPTDVYTLTGDGWANWDDGANIYGMFTEHLEYLGLTPTEIADATVTTDGLTNYYAIDSSSVNDLAALYNQLLLALDFGAVTPSAEIATISADLHALGVDLGADLFSALGVPELLLP